MPAVGSGLESEEVDKVVVTQQLHKKRLQLCRLVLLIFLCVSRVRGLIYQSEIFRLVCLVELVTSMMMFPLIDSLHQHIINFWHRVFGMVNVGLILLSRNVKHLFKIVRL